MRKLKNKILSIIILLIFIVSLNTVINATYNQKLTESSNNCSSCDNNTNMLEDDQCSCMLLNGKYAVMTDREIKPKTYIPDEDPEPTGSFDNLPSQFSWNSYGGDWLTPVKDQGNCGSCWDFSALGTMEAAINLASGYPDTDIDLSEQYVLSCLPYGGSCNGGWTDDAFEAIINPSLGNDINGVPLESCMPYEANDNIPCSDKCEDWDVYNMPPQADDILWQLEDWGANHNFDNTNPSDRDIVKSWLMDKGPLSVSMYASNSFSSYWDSHHNPNDWFYEGNYGSTNHAVVLVGWVDDPDITNGGYWIVKNSWGTGWGYGGYFNAAYGGQDIGRIVRWCKTFDWPQSQSGSGPIDYNLAVFSNFDYISEYPHPGDEIDFTDLSDGEVALREWDFDGDKIIDSNQKNPSHIYYNEGEYEVTLNVTSSWGIKSNRTRIIEVKEIWPPVAVLPSEFVDNSLTYSFDGRYSYDPDGGSIKKYHWDFGDGGISDDMYTIHSFPKPDVIYNVTLTVTDNDGASGSTICQVKIDQTVPPETEILHLGCYELQEWYSSTQRIYFIANDWTSVIDTFYRIDNGTWIKYEPGKQEYIPVGSEGEHTVECYSVDYWVNKEAIVSETFFIDKIKPTVDITITGGEQINGWYTNPVTVEVSAEDDYSGVEEINYKMDGNFWNKYTNSFIINEGRHQIWVVVVDKAGNSFEENIDINIDLSDPETLCKFFPESTNNRFYKNVELRVLGSDKGSGVKDTFYNLDNQGFKTYYQPIIIDVLGVHTVEYYSIDYIGNQEQIKTTTFTISNLNFDFEITEPKNGLYLFGMRLLPIRKIILIGTAEIQVTVQPFTQEPANIDHIDFLLDGDIQKTLTESPYTWVIEEKITGTHTIQAIAYTNNDETISDEITATLLLI